VGTPERPASKFSRLQPSLYNAAQDLIERNLLAGRGEKIAFIDAEGGYTYCELADRVDRCAVALLTLGIEAEQRVALCLLDTIDFPSCFLGAIKAGIVPVLLNTSWESSEFAFALNDSRAKAVVVSESLLPAILEAAALARWHGQIVVSGKAAGNLPSLAELAKAVQGPGPVAETRPDDICFWLYSSGSTGNPKATLHLQTSMVRTAELFARGVLGVGEDDVIYSSAKLFFAYGLGNSLSFPLTIGATSVLYFGRPSVKAVSEILQKFRPTIFCAVPTLFASLLASSDSPGKEPLSLRLCTSAGEALPEHLARTWVACTGVEIVDGIGSTEMLHIFISNRPGSPRYGTTGQPVPGYQARILDELGQEVAAGEMGELYVSGPTAAAGYWNNQSKTRSTFRGEWVKTGDRFRQNAEGDYIYCGRSDEMLKVSGMWVSPTEIESVLLSHQDVLEAAVVGAPDENGLMKPKAYVVVKAEAGEGAELIGEFSRLLREHLPPYKCPQWIEIVDQLPKTASGKIRRNVLRSIANQPRKKAQWA
jgi:benzoate-CoA ligase